MPLDLGSPKVISQRKDPSLSAAPGPASGSWNFIGVTERGEIGKPIFVSSWADFKKKFGNFLADHEMPLAVYRAFKGKGGKRFFITRVVHFTDPDDKTTAASAASTITLKDRATPSVNTLTVSAISDGAWGDDIDVEIIAATSGNAAEFDLKVSYNDVEVEYWQNLKIGTANVGDSQYVETVINENSNYITVEDELSVTASPNNMPAIASTALAAGGDGLTGLVAADFTGEAALKSIELLSETILNVCTPGRQDCQADVFDYCETKKMFYLMEVDSTEITAADAVSWIGTATLEDKSEFGAIFYPYVKILNPDQSVYGLAAQIEASPVGGLIAGAVTQDAKAGGVHAAFCGMKNGIQGDVLGLVDEAVNSVTVRDYLYSHKINVIMKSKTGLFYAKGTRCLKLTGSFPSIGETRGTMSIEHQVDDMLEKYPDDNITDSMLREMYSEIDKILTEEMNDDAFASKIKEEAYYINMGTEMNPPSELYAHRINIEIGLAKAQPCEWIILTFTKDVRSIQQELSK